MFSSKVFFIGFPKTGTTSAKRAMRQLGCRVCGHVPAQRGWTRDQLAAAAAPLVPKYDVFQNFPWALLYRDLDESFPGSKFVLTYREDSRWIQSVTRHFGGRSTVLREIVFGQGDPQGHEQQYLQVYQRHNAEVRDYFAGRDDFLDFGLTQGEGWEKLGPFLGIEAPARSFPHANQRIVQRVLERFWRRRAG